jgi:hypothetical protein
MFTEYDVAGIIHKTGLRPNGTGWRDLMANNQFTAANQGADFTKIMMKVFDMIETNVMSEKYHPLSTTPKGRYFEHCVVNEREQYPRWMGLNKRGGTYETYQYFADTGESLICKNCVFAEQPSEDTYSGIAPEIVKKRLRDKVATKASAASNVQLVRDNFSSDTPAPAHRIGHKLGELHRICLVGGFMGKATRTHHRW